MPNDYLINGHTIDAIYAWRFTPNVRLFDAALSTIHAKPKAYDQRYWVGIHAECGTTHCLAGWGIMLAYPEARFQMDDLDGVDVVYIDRDDWDIRTLATQLFGLTPYEALYLFEGDRTIDEIESAVKELTNGKRLVRYDNSHGKSSPVWEDRDV